MPKKQTRRAVSLKPEIYQRLKSYCDEQGCSMSSVVEDVIAGFFEGQIKRATVLLRPTISDTYPGSDILKDVPPAAAKPPIRGGGIHEL